MVDNLDQIATFKRNSDNAAAKAAAEAAAVISGKVESYSQWVEVLYDNSMKDIIKRYNDGDTVPFSSIVIGGNNNKWTGYTEPYSATYIGARDTNIDNRYGHLILEDDDTLGVLAKSGFFKCILAPDWQVQITIRTYEEDWIKDNTYNADEDLLQFDDTREKKFPDWGEGAFDEKITFTMMKDGDMIGIDIDDRSTVVGNFELVINGEDYIVSSPYENDNEAVIVVHKAWHWQPNHSTTEVVGSDTIKAGAVLVTGEGTGTITNFCPAGFYEDENGECVANTNPTEEDDNYSMIWVLGIGLIVVVALGFKVGA